MAKQIKNEQKKMNPLLWFLFAVIIPVMVAISILLIILNVAGVDVSGWTKDKVSSVPVLSSFVSEDEESNVGEDTDQIQARVAEKDEEIEQLNEEIRGLETTIERLNQDIIKLENRNEQNTEQSNENEEENEAVSSISGSFKDMDSEQAALILQNMENETALSILQAVSNKVRGQILEEMDPEIAADLTQLLIES
jgi:flagellar motility protein MotE (MotC chaperone)